MNLLLERDVLTDKFTLGKLSVNGKQLYFTCEDTVRAEKIKGETAIPAGNYNVVITYSNRFKKLMPLLENVPGFDGVRIHGGNTSANTEGCILVGANRTADGVRNCSGPLHLLQMDIQRELDAKRKVIITIKEASDDSSLVKSASQLSAMGRASSRVAGLILGGPALG